MSLDTIEHAYTFDDLLLVPAASEVLPNEVSLVTQLTKSITLNIPLVSAAMDTVTEHRAAITMAREGGIGIIHKNMSVEEQIREVRKVKKSESGMVIDPITVTDGQTVREVNEIMRNYRISGVPVLRGTKLVGIVTNRDLRFVSDEDLLVREVMTSKNLVTAKVGTTLEQSKALLHEHRIEKLLVVDDDGDLQGLITIKDIEKVRKYPNAAKDDLGRLRVGAAIGVNSSLEHVEKLINVGVDVVVLDSAHGHSRNILNALTRIKDAFPELQVIAGNVATAEGAEALIRAGADCVKVGVGPGSICTTRIVAGVGVPQMTAIHNCSQAAEKFGIPVIADGGIKYSGEIAKAIGIGARVVMIGSLFAGTDESPGETFLYQGRTYKGYRGMGSLGAMKQGSSDRYFQEGVESQAKFVPEGIEGKVPYRGPLSDMIYQLMGGLRSGMGYLGAATIEELRQKAKFVKITAAGLKESHVHDVIITKEAPNYRMG
ncbi:IMP dehydrogenase [Thiovibrio frasassiensis]|uniref:Inosine-5'-monophosphate dehydrogenase n=1 Tax=Thiovibrio frasassiensis TaxID=2984131 RepID=A0A9X4RLD9_9BACT|nr:IMP dehydrogenase [Thiovibrio frasassiensis]MDG4475584.1 IMP dehydrogenase [Thiovibrio frasassiensis]